MSVENLYMKRRSVLKLMGATVAAGPMALARPARAAGPVNIGLLTPLSGALAFVGETNQNCLQLAVDEINAQGGLLGREIRIVAEDTQMSTQVALDKARKLIASDDVAMIIGTVLPSEREAALQAAVAGKRLVIHPNFDEGRCHPNLLTTGLAENQYVEPLIDWAAKNIGKRVYVLASDLGTVRKTFLPRVKASLERVGGSLAGVQLFPFGTRDFGPAFQQVKAAAPDIVWHSIGDDPITFVKQYKSFEMKPQLVTQLAHESIAVSTAGASVGDIGVAAYFMSLANAANERFLADYTRKFSAFTPRRIGDRLVMLPHGENTYAGAKIFAEAARIAGSLQVDKLQAALPQVALELPRGPVRVARDASHLLCRTLIGRVRMDNGFDVLAQLGPIAPTCG